MVHPGNGSATAAQASAIGATGAGSVNLAIPADFKLSQLTSLSTDYKMVVGSCWNGSPRFTANVTNGTSNGSVFFYLAPPPTYAGCASDSYAKTGTWPKRVAPSFLEPSRWIARGTLLGCPGQVRQLHGDSSAPRCGRRGGRNQTVDFDNTEFNGQVVTYEPEHGISFLMERTGGTVKVKEPGERGFKNAKKLEKVPFNSVVDTRGGKVKVTAATGKFADTTADAAMTFYDGKIRLQQKGARTRRRSPSSPGSSVSQGRPGQAKAGKSSGPVATTSRNVAGGSGAAAAAATELPVAVEPEASSGPPGSPRTPATGPCSG